MRGVIVCGNEFRSFSVSCRSDESSTPIGPYESESGGAVRDKEFLRFRFRFSISIRIFRCDANRVYLKHIGESSAEPHVGESL